MARKKRYKRSQPMPPKAAGSVWEVGRQPLSVAQTSGQPEVEQPDLLLMVEVANPSLVVFSSPVMSSDSPDYLVQRVQQAMHEPLVGEPRRPACIRVRTESDADMLRMMTDTAGIELEVVPDLGALDAMHADFMQALGGIEGSYRMRAGQLGAPLSAAGLRALFEVAARFFREESWWLADDTELFQFDFNPDVDPEGSVAQSGRSVKTMYGVLMGHEGEEFGMALYTSLEHIEQVYSLDIEGIEKDPSVFDDDTPLGEAFDEVTKGNAHSLWVPCLGLTFRPEHELSEWLVAEAVEFNLPLATPDAFPLVMRIGQGGMQLAAPKDLRDMLTSLEALLGWEEELDKLDGGEDEDDVPMTVRLKAIEGFRPAMTVRVTLIDNPYAPEGEFSEIDDLEPFEDFDDGADVGFRDMQTVVDQLLVNFPELGKLNSLGEDVGSAPPQPSELDEAGEC